MQNRNDAVTLHSRLCGGPPLFALSHERGERVRSVPITACRAGYPSRLGRTDRISAQPAPAARVTGLTAPFLTPDRCTPSTGLCAQRIEARTLP
jgi:hypothetical protein